MVYHITIVEYATGNVSNLRRESERTLDSAINKELGGWDNLHAATTSGCTPKQR
jgi:hypothetical protein